MTRAKISLFGGATLFLLAASANAEIGWALVNAKIRRDFPRVTRITTAELAEWLNDAQRVVPLLLDVRTAAEFSVSHLPGARQVEPEASAGELTAGKNEPIVTYCSVGYRSGAFAEKLRAAGFTDVRNLKGSIFQWANEGRPLVREGAKAEQVHPYDRTWGLLLKKKYRARVASVAPKN